MEDTKGYPRVSLMLSSVEFKCFYSYGSRESYLSPLLVYCNSHMDYSLYFYLDVKGGTIIFVGFWRLQCPTPSPDATILSHLDGRERGVGANCNIL